MILAWPALVGFVVIRRGAVVTCEDYNLVDQPDRLGSVVLQEVLMSTRTDVAKFLCKKTQRFSRRARCDRFDSPQHGLSTGYPPDSERTHWGGAQTRHQNPGCRCRVSGVCGMWDRARTRSQTAELFPLWNCALLWSRLPMTGLAQLQTKVQINQHCVRTARRQ